MANPLETPDGFPQPSVPPATAQTKAGNTEQGAAATEKAASAAEDARAGLRRAFLLQAEQVRAYRAQRDKELNERADD
jgi:hypothetical protein